MEQGKMVIGPLGFTETFTDEQIDLLERMGLIKFYTETANYKIWIGYEMVNARV